MNSYDVVIIGGGLTGCAAAMAAARRNASVLLLESSGFLGGAAGNCLVYPFMPYKTKVKDDAGNEVPFTLSRGIFTELCKEILRDGSNSHFSDEDLKLLLDRKLAQAGVNVLFHACLCGVKKEGAALRSVSVATKAGVFTFEGKVFIDCTGDADLCAYAGISLQLGRPEDNLCQPMTLCFRMINVDKPRFFAARNEWQEKYKDYQNDGRITNPRENILVFDHVCHGVLHFNTTRVVKLNPVDPFDLSRAEAEARKQVDELMRFFKEEHIPGMENAELMCTAPSIGVRESRMLKGAYVLTAADLMSLEKFDDAIAAGNYDIDIHSPTGSGTSHYYFQNGTWYTIPYRSLTPEQAECENLLVGGRCISADHEAQASIRIMPICCTTGEAAGAAAAMAAKSGSAVQQIDVAALQQSLTAAGAYIGL